MRSDNMPRPSAPEHGEQDIVERLRAYVADNGLWTAGLSTHDVLSAAEEIKLLRAERTESAQIKCLVDIRYAVGDNGLRMQDELVEYIKGIVAERDKLRQVAKDNMDWFESLKIDYDKLRERIEQHERFEMFVIGEGAWQRFLDLESKITPDSPHSDDYRRLCDGLKKKSTQGAGKE